MSITNFDKAKVLNQALPYIKEFSRKKIVVKIGGSVLEDLLEPTFIHDLVLMKFVGIEVVVVHGGGNKVSHIMERLGKEAKFVDGLRVTDPEAMEITQMVLAGINKDLVAAVQKAGGNAVGLSGKDANLVMATKLTSTTSGVDLGRVGEVTKVNPQLLLQLMTSNYIPVISSVASDEENGSFNVNADHFATEIAMVLKAEKLIFLSDVDGVLDNSSGEEKLINKIAIGEINSLIKKKIVAGGMIPKLHSAKKSIEAGITHVHFLSGRVPHSLLVELFTTEGIGTQIHSD